jgi:hypothetical protein
MQKFFTVFVLTFAASLLVAFVSPTQSGLSASGILQSANGSTLTVKYDDATVGTVKRIFAVNSTVAVSYNAAAAGQAPNFVSLGNGQVTNLSGTNFMATVQLQTNAPSLPTNAAIRIVAQ